MRNLATPVKVGILVVLGLVAFFIFLSFIQDDRMKGEANEYWARMVDASGLAPKTPVRVAGIPVGEVAAIGLEGGKARVTMMVRASVPVYPNASLAKRSASILGDYVLDLNPGFPRSPDEKPMPSGSEIRDVQEAIQLEKLIESAQRITQDVESITRNLRDALASEDSSIKEIVQNLERITVQLDRTIASSSAQLEAILENANAITSDVRRLTDAKDDEIAQIITNIRTITEQTQSILSSIQAVVGDNETELKESVGGVKQALASLNDTLGKIERGEGTIGRLVSDEELAQKVEAAVEDASEYITDLAKFRAEVSVRSEFLLNERGTKNYVALRLIPRPDKYFLLEAIDDPRGFVERQTIVRSPPGADEAANQEVRITSDTLKFSAQFAKRYSFATFRFGLVESSGGAGLDLHFLEDHLIFKIDAFEFANPEKDYPRVKPYLNLLFLDHLFVTAGGDDVLNAPVTEATTGRILSGRDFFMGGGIYFTDEDLRVLLGAVPVPGN